MNNLGEFVIQCQRIDVPDYLKPLAHACQRISAVLGIKKRRKVAPSARDDQLRVKVPVLVDSEQSVSDLAFFQERPANPPGVLGTPPHFPLFSQYAAA